MRFLYIGNTVGRGLNNSAYLKTLNFLKVNVRTTIKARELETLG
jgi:hypothetical protein